MTVQQLIEELEKVENKLKPVYFVCCRRHVWREDDSAQTELQTCDKIPYFEIYETI